MKTLKVRPARRLKAELTLPGDKSIAHRAALFSSFAKGNTHISGFPNNEDCLSSLNVVRALGTQVERAAECSYAITGINGHYAAPAGDLDCGNSGTTMRLISGLLAGQPFESRLTGDPSLSKRPMQRIADPLRQMGASIICEGEENRPPIRIQGGNLKGTVYKTPVPSAQIKSCVLLAGLQAEGTTEVREDYPSRDHSERMLKHFGIELERDETSVRLAGDQSLQANDVAVPGDFSSGAFWLVAGSVFPGAQIALHKIGLNPTRTGLLKILTRMGAKITEEVNQTTPEPFGSLFVEGHDQLQGTEVGGKEIPNVIDELPILAVLGALAQGTTIIRDAAELRVKETDRIAALAVNLRAFGVPVEEQPDGIIIQGGHKLEGATVKSFGDHRIAMAFAVLGLFAKGETLIEDTACIATSYPTFEADLAKVTH